MAMFVEIRQAPPGARSRRRAFLTNSNLCNRLSSLTDAAAHPGTGVAEVVSLASSTTLSICDAVDAELFDSILDR
jgi:hypothetical protein